MADWAAFNRGDSFPAFVRGQAMQDQLTGINIPIGGFIDAAKRQGWTLLPSCWAGAIPSSFVTRDAFERLAGVICADVAEALSNGLDAIYLDLHGAAVAEHVADSEGELLARLRQIVGPHLHIVASLDLHANVTHRMLGCADALVAYRTYPHVDMAATGELAAALLARRIKGGQREPLHHRRLPFLIPINAQSTWLAPAQDLYDGLALLDRAHGTVLSFCMGFPASDFAECAPMVWGYGAAAAQAFEQLYAQPIFVKWHNKDKLNRCGYIPRRLRRSSNSATSGSCDAKRRIPRPLGRGSLFHQLRIFLPASWHNISDRLLQQA